MQLFADLEIAPIWLVVQARCAAAAPGLEDNTTATPLLSSIRASPSTSA